VPGSRVDHNNGDPSTIEIKIYHFSAAQAVAEDGYSDSWSLLGGCFIASAVPGSLFEPYVKDSNKSWHTFPIHMAQILLLIVAFVAGGLLIAGKLTMSHKTPTAPLMR